MSNTKKLKQAIIGITSVAATLGAVAATLGVLFLSTNKRNLNSAQELFQKYNPSFAKHIETFLPDEEERNKYLGELKNIEDSLSNEQISALEKYKTLYKLFDKQKDIVFSWANRQISKGFDVIDLRILKSVLLVQQDRLQEVDIKNQFNSLENTNLDLALSDFTKLSQEKQHSWLSQYQLDFDSKLEEQYSLMEQNLMQSNNSLDDNIAQLNSLLPTSALRHGVQININNIEKALFAPFNRINDINLNKIAIEQRILEAKSPKYDAFRAKYSLKSKEFNATVVANVKNVANSFINSIKQYNDQLSEQAVQELSNLSSKISETQSVQFNVNEFNKLVEYAKVNKLVSAKDLNTILHKPSIYHFMSLSNYYLSNTLPKLDASMELSDLDETESQLNIYKKSLDDFEAKSVADVIKEFNEFVNNSQNKLIRFKSSFTQFVILDKNFVKLTSPENQNLDKTFVFDAVTKYRNDINTLINLETKVKDTFDALEKASKLDVALIYNTEIDTYNDKITQSIRSSRNLDQLLASVSNDVNSAHVLVETRKELSKIRLDIETKVLKLNEFEPQILDIYLSDNAKQLATSLSSEILRFNAQSVYDVKTLSQRLHDSRERYRAIEKIVLVQLEQITQQRLEELVKFDNDQFQTLDNERQFDLSKTYISVANIEKLVKQINTTSNIITSKKFNPIITAEISKQIEKYRAIVNILETAYTQNKAIIEIGDAHEYARRSFNPTNQVPPQFSSSQQAYLNKLQRSQDSLQERTQKINNLVDALKDNFFNDEAQHDLENVGKLNSKEQIQKIDDLNKVVVTNQKVVKDIEDASRSLEDIKETKKLIEAEKFGAKVYEDDFKKLAEIEKSLTEESGKDVSDLEKIKSLKEQAFELKKNIDTKRKDGSLNVKISQVKALIDKEFGANKPIEQQSEGERSIRERLDAIASKADAALTNPELRAQYSDETEALERLIPEVKKLENKLEQYNQKANKYKKDRRAKKRVNEQISESKNVTDKIGVINSDITQNDNVPTPDKIRDTFIELEKAEEQLDLAFNKDVIQHIVEEIQDKKYPTSAGFSQSKTDLNNKIEELSKYALEKLESTSPNEVKNIKEIVESQNQLVDEIKRAIAIEELVENDPDLSKDQNKLDKEQIAKVINQNLPSVANGAVDSVDTIKSKIEKVKSIILETDRKHQIRSILHNQLEKVLSSSESTNRVLEKIKNEIDADKTRYLDILASNPQTYSVDELDKFIVELNDKIKRYNDEKERALGHYQRAKDEAIQGKSELDKRIQAIQKENPNFKFENYEKAVQELESDFRDTTNSTADTIKQKHAALLFAFTKDRVKNQYEVYKGFTTSNTDSEANTAFKAAKDYINNFKKYVEGENEKNLSEQKAIELIELMQEMQRFNDSQVEAVKQLNEWERSTSPDADTKKGIADIKSLLSELPSQSPFSKENIAAKHKEFIEKLKIIKQIVGLRTENKAKINLLNDYFANFHAKPEKTNEGEGGQKVVNPLRSKADAALHEALNKDVDLPNNVDNNFIGITKGILDRLKDENAKAPTLDEIKKISVGLSVIEAVKDFDNALALEVGSIHTIISQSSAIKNNLVRSFIDQALTPLIEQSRTLYANIEKDITASSNIDTETNKAKEQLKAQISKIESYKDAYRKSLAIKEVLDKLKELNSKIDYHKVSGVSGENNRAKVDAWLEAIANSALYNPSNDINAINTLLDKAQSAINKAKEYIEAQAQASQLITKWNAESSKEPIIKSTLKDEESLTQAIWNIVSKAHENLSADQINTLLEELNKHVKDTTTIRDARIANLNAINNIKQLDIVKSISGSSRFLRTLDSRISALNRSTTDASTHEALMKLKEQIDIFTQLLNDEVKLLDKIDQTRQHASVIQPLNEDIKVKKEELLKKLDEYTLILSKQTPTKAELDQRRQEIEKAIKIIDLHKARLDVFTRSSDIRNEVDSNTDLDPKEKEYLKQKFDAFKNELDAIVFDENTQAKQFEDVGNKYLQGSTTNSIEYIYNKAKELNVTLTRAERILDTNDDVNGEKVSSALSLQHYNELAKLIQQAKDLIANASDSNFAQRATIIKGIGDTIDKLLTSKQVTRDTLKSKVDKINSLLNNGSVPNSGAVLQEFSDAIREIAGFTITNAKSNPIEAIKKYNDLFAKVIKATDAQVRKTYKDQQQLLKNEFDKVSTLISELNPDLLWTAELKTLFERVKNSKNQSESFLNQNKLDEAALKQFSAIEGKDFGSEYLIKNRSLINEITQDFKAFSDKFKEEIDSIVTVKVGELVKAFDAANNAKKSSGSTTIFEQARLLRSKLLFEALKSESDTLTSEITNLKDFSLISNISKTAVKLRTFYDDFNRFVESLKDEIEANIDKRESVDEVLKFVLKDANADTQQIKAEYKKLHDAAKEAHNAITKASQGTGKGSYVTDNYLSISKDKIDTYLSKFFEFYDALNSDDQSKGFNAQLTKLISNTTASVKDGIILEHFEREFDAIKSNFASGANEFDFTEHQRFLDSFSAFTGTKLDTSNKFNAINVRAKLVKDTSTTDWFKLTTHNESQKTIQFKVKYEYKPTNLNIFDNYKGFSVEKTIEATFTTANEIKLEQKSNRIFFIPSDNGMSDQFGYAAKQKVANAKELGWDVNTLEAAKMEFIQKFKQAAGLDNNVSRVAFNHYEYTKPNLTQEQINEQKTKFKIAEKQSRTKKVIKYMKNGSSSNNKVESEYSSSKLKLKFIFPGYAQYQSSSNFLAQNENQIILLSVTSDNQIQAQVILPTSLFVGRSDGNKNQNSNLIDLFTGGGVSNGDVNARRTMPSAALITLKFGIDFDTQTKDINLFVTHYEMYNVVKNKSLTDTTYEKELPNTDYKNKWSDHEFAQYLADHWELWGEDTKWKEIEKQTNSGEGTAQMLGSDNKLWIANSRIAGKYISTASTSGEEIKKQTQAETSKLLPVYNTGIDIFEFNDIKKPSN